MVLSLGIPKLSSRSPPQRRNLTRSSSATSTLTEALRSNPFGTKARAVDALDENGFEPQQSNSFLTTLARLFPDVKIEVLRELLTRFSGESRLQLCAEQLLKYKAEWVKGRWNIPPTDADEELPLEEMFRSNEYKNAAKATLYVEFRALSKSTVEAVLAENNFSYSRARPVLQGLLKRTWRAAIGNLNIFKKKRDRHEPPSYLFERSSSIESEPILRHTGCPELDAELRNVFLRVVAREQKEEQELADRELAEAVNRVEAQEMSAIYECGCCCGDVTFESISTCTTEAHIICHNCVRRTLQEALFGQGWSKSIDVNRGTLKCLAPLLDDDCEGCIPQTILHAAVVSQRSGKETWHKFEERLAAESLLKSQMKLVHCPFCTYAEADPAYNPSSSVYRSWRMKTTKRMPSVLILVFIVDILPLLIFLGLLFSLLSATTPSELFQRALQNISSRHRSSRFTCRNPSCARKSCLKCSKAWHDPHACHEPLLLSLRTTVEAARTAAVKRTCPRCGLAFVKASGCNKLTCLCGYSMCYLCRKSLGSVGGVVAGGYRRLGDDTAEGYRHFCEHFRINPGMPCAECRKCDLYRAEDEDAVVRLAGEEAEREWRIKEGMVGVEGFGKLPGDVDRKKSWLQDVAIQGHWTMQDLVDWVVGMIVEVEA